MRRREFIVIGGAVTAWPHAARAQQRAMPVIGFLSVTLAGEQPHWLAAFRKGLSETGYIEGHNVSIEYRWAEGQYNRLPELAADLIRHNVSVIVTPPSDPAALAAKAATTAIPIVFSVGQDPVRLGLVASLSRPGGNATGINILAGEIMPKRLGVLHELLPKAVRITVLVNPANVPTVKAALNDIPEAARALGLQIQVLNASNGDALLVAPDTFLGSRRAQIAILSARHSVPTIYTSRDAPETGGLISYGPDVADTVRQQGFYAGQILKGTKPGDLPVVQSTKFELVINLRTAKAIGLEVPATLLSRADGVID